MKKALWKIKDWKLWELLWGFYVILLPLTSVPIIVQLVHSDVVAAPSALILPFLLIGAGLTFILEKRDFPASLSPMVLFIITALIATAVSFYYRLPYYKGVNPFSSSLNAVITLFVGFCFYLVTLLHHKNEASFRTTFKLLSISGAIVCLWTFAQAICWYKFHRYPQWMKDIQFSLSVGPLYRQRFVGFTLEPSWLAHQLNLLYLPFWFAASLTGYSAFRIRFKFITVERILFAAGTTVLFLTLSRVGLAAFLLTVGFAAVVGAHRMIKKTADKFSAGRKGAVTILAYFVIILTLAAIAYGTVRLLMKLDYRMAGLFDIRVAGRSDPIFYIAEKLSLAARFVYWDGGLSIFNEHPLLGVGLGHAGFYLPRIMNEYAYRLPEVNDLLYRSTTLLNIKSLWIRILAETGIIGFIFFFAWYLRSLLSHLPCLNADSRLKRTAAWMGCFALLAFLIEGFSLDTFALPYIWFCTGLTSAAGELKDEI
ncbi:MAG: O-antigen ligase family protein [Anaerolineaceae bacterium]|nr:O-antigen ligase family protein [Anaerolineaceae bacterium]